MTLGVMQRTERLARRDAGVFRDGNGFICSAEYSEGGRRPPFRSLVGLQQIVAESMGRGVNTKGVRTKYMELVDELGNELHILMDVGYTGHIAGWR